MDVDESSTKKVRGKREKKTKIGDPNIGILDVPVDILAEKAVTGEISEMGDKRDGGEDGEVTSKKKRKRSRKGLQGDGDGGASVPGATTSAPAISLESVKLIDGPTPEEVKQKRSYSGLEKKKAKVVKGKRTGETVKEGLIGKKGL